MVIYLKPWLGRRYKKMHGNYSKINFGATCSSYCQPDVYLINIFFTTLNFINMKKKLFNLSNGMHLEDAPLVYLHEEFKIINKKKLKNNWVWYSLQDLKDIVAEIENLDDENLQKEGDGVRLYYGIYNKRVCDYLTAIKKMPPNENRIYADHDGHNTVFFVPTYKIKGRDEKIDDINMADLAKLKEAYKNNLEIPVPKNITGGYNVGNICPPPPTGKPDCKGSGSQL